MDVSKLSARLPIVAAIFGASLPMMTLPFLIGVSTAAGLSTDQAGWIGTSSMGGVAVGAMLSSPVTERLSLRKLAVGSGLILALSYAALAGAQAAIGFFGWALLGGLSAGVLLAVASRIIAPMPDPDRIYGVAYAATSGLSAVLLFALPLVIEAFGSNAACFTMAVCAIVVASSVTRLRSGPALHEDSPSGFQAVNRKLVAGLVLVIVVAFPVYGGTYGFIERKAAEVSMNPELLGTLFLMAMILGAVGTTVVGIVGTRYGRTFPTVIVMAIATISYYLSLNASSPAELAVGFLTYGFMQLALNAYFFGLASVLDPSGRIASLLQGFCLIPYALGPGLFGTVAGDGSLTALAAPAAAINIIATIMLLPILMALDRGKSAPIAL